MWLQVHLFWQASDGGVQTSTPTVIRTVVIHYWSDGNTAVMMSVTQVTNGTDACAVFHQPSVCENSNQLNVLQWIHPSMKTEQWFFFIFFLLWLIFDSNRNMWALFDLAEREKLTSTLREKKKPNSIKKTFSISVSKLTLYWLSQ